MTTVLSHIRVLDLGGGQAASMAGLILAQAGAQVTKIDDGTSTFTPVEDALWNRGKSRLALDLGATEGRHRLQALLADSDILVHDRLPTAASLLGLDAATLTAQFPMLIHVAVGGWPAGHPNAETPVRDNLVLAKAGILDEQAAIGRDGPVWLRFPLGSNHAAYLAAIGALARLYARRRKGRGGPVHTSLLQGALVPMMMHWSTAERPTPALRFGMPKDAGATLFECSDGRWVHTMGQPVKAPGIKAALDAMDGVERARLNAKYEKAIIKYIDDRGAIEAIFKTRPRQDWLEELWASDVPAQPVQAMGDLYFDEQTQANGYVVPVDDPRLGATRQPGSPIQMDEGVPLAAEPTVAAQALSQPLDGLKVLDIGNFLAGPLAPMLLGDLGAEVIKVEATSGDPLRHADWAFNGCQRNKRGIALQLKDPAASALLGRLFDWADVVHHNQRMMAAEKLGFGYAAVHARNPRAVYCHVSSYGAKGPRRDWPGYDQLFQAASGWEAAGAGEGNPPAWHRFGMMDHLCGLASVVGTLLAVLRRDATGQGEFVAASLLGASLATVETLVLPDGSLAPTAQLDRRQMGVGPTRRLYPCGDGWLAVDQPHAAPDALADAEARFRDVGVEQAARIAAEAGVDAAPVALANGQAFLADPVNQSSGLSVALDHPVYGSLRQIGALWDFGDLRLRLERAPPLLGQHSRDILAEVGVSAGAIDEALASGVVKAAG
ncbi:MAG: CoA transferase [Azospirillaceae bacterium]|nr:CoA transferase [Azospirillaceae bacterium]